MDGRWPQGFALRRRGPARFQIALAELFTQVRKAAEIAGVRTASILIARCLRPSRRHTNTGVVAFSNSNTTLTLTGNNDLANAGAILRSARAASKPLPDPQAGTQVRAVNQADQLKPASPAIRDPALLARAVNQADQLRPTSPRARETADEILPRPFPGPDVPLRLDPSLLVRAVESG